MIRFLSRLRRRSDAWSAEHGVFITREPRSRSGLVTWNKRDGVLFGARLRRHTIRLVLNMIIWAAGFYLLGALIRLAEALITMWGMVR